jgi:hypothetical protein
VIQKITEPAGFESLEQDNAIDESLLYNEGDYHLHDLPLVEDNISVQTHKDYSKKRNGTGGTGINNDSDDESSILSYH